MSAKRLMPRTEQPGPPDLRPALVAILVIGAVLRLNAAVQAAFPLGDGGLFFAAVEGIRASGGIPPTISFNGEIPFVYPPLGFVVGALVSSIPGVGTESMLRFLPPTLAIATLAVVPWCAARMLRSAPAGLMAGAIVAVMPQSYDQLVAGGGLTRGLGTVLALVAIGAAAGSRGTPRGGVVVGLLLGLSALTHPRVAMFAVVSVAYVWWRDRNQLSGSEAIVAIGVALACVVPWLGLLVTRDQLSALTAGGQRFDLLVGAVSLLLYPGMQTMHGGIPNVGVALSLAGVTACLLVRRWSILVWLVAVHLVNSPPFVSAVAWAIAGAAGLLEVTGWLTQRFALTRSNLAVPVGIIALVAVLSASASPADPGSKQQPLTPDQLSGARRLAELPDTARLGVVTSETWGNDVFGEWLPTLSGRVVVTTPQGSEWLGSAEFEARRDAHVAGEHCSRRTSDCIASAIEGGILRATHVVIPRGSVAGPRAPDDCCPALLDTIRDDDRFQIVLDTPGVLVAAWRG